jgi:hypothetical protein
MIIVAVWLTSAIALTAFAVDVGNWFVHRRHLQNQADAAALAGGDSFGIPCGNGPILSNTYNYGGPEANHPSSQYNAQYDAPPANKFHLLINATDYWNKGGTDFSDGGQPCTTGFVDVKLTEAPHGGLAFFAWDLLPTINTHARVELRKETTKAGSLPIAFPNPLPKEAAALFIDETKSATATDQILARMPLADTGPAGGGLDGWSGAGISVPIQSRTTGVVIATAGQTGALSGSTFTTGTLAAICSQPLVSCYDATNNPPTNGVDFIRGYSSGNGQQPNPPALGDVELFYTGGCSDAWFMSTTTSCNIGIEAKIDARDALGNPIAASDIEITAFSTSAAGSGNCLKPNQGCTLTLDSGSAQCTLLQGAGRCWRSSTIPMGNVTGPVPIFIHWKEKTGIVGTDACTGNKCSADFEGGGVIQRSFNADDPTVDTPNAGPLKVLTLYQCSGGSCLTSGIQSFAIGSSPTLNVAIGIAGTLQNAPNTTDANALCGVNSQGQHFSCLKVAVTNSGNTQALDCDPNANPWYNELAYGCVPVYTVNNGTPNCLTTGKNTLWASQQPWSCIATTTGNKKSDVAKGLNLRILKSTTPSSCPPNVGDLGHNNWNMYNPSIPQTLGFPPGDPRLVQAYLTAYGAFANTSGTSTTVPIIGFGSFYVTGWTPGQGQGFANPCQGAGDDPVPGNNGGIIVGHFVRYIDTINTGGGTETCDMSTSAFGNCVPVLTQ